MSSFYLLKGPTSHDTWYQRAHPAPQCWFLNALLPWKKPGLPGEEAHSRAGAREVQKETGTPCITIKDRACSKDKGAAQDAPNGESQGSLSNKMDNNQCSWKVSRSYKTWEDQGVITSWRRPRRKKNQMRCGIPDWILEQKRNISEDTGKIQIRSVVQLMILYQW